MVQVASPILDRATPPAHSVAFIAILTAACLLSLPSADEIDEHATIENFTSTHFGWLSIGALACIRLSFAFLGLCTTIYSVLYKEIEVVPSYKKYTKLKQPGNWIMRGMGTQAFFTQWSWSLLSTSFALSGTIALMAANGRSDLIEDNPWLLRLALLTFETAAPTEFLVATVIKYAIWPQILSNGRKTDGLKTVTAYLMHNGCIFMILIEVAMLGTIPVELSHIAVAPLFGITYVLFAWYMSDKWRRGEGRQFLYFFLDTTLGWETTVALVALALVLGTFYFVFWLAEDIMMHIPGLTGRIGAVIALSTLVCRFRD